MRLIFAKAKIRGSISSILFVELSKLKKFNRRYLNSIHSVFFRYIASSSSVVQWLCHSPCKSGVACSIPGFSSPSDGTINRGPVSI